jgi:hypothetical protein
MKIKSFLYNKLNESTTQNHRGHVLPPSFDLLEHKVHGSLSNLKMQNENREVVRSSIPLGSYL